MMKNSSNLLLLFAYGPNTPRNRVDIMNVCFFWRPHLLHSLGMGSCPPIRPMNFFLHLALFPLTKFPIKKTLCRMVILSVISVCVKRQGLLFLRKSISLSQFGPYIEFHKAQNTIFLPFVSLVQNGSIIFKLNFKPSFPHVRMHVCIFVYCSSLFINLIYKSFKILTPVSKKEFY